MKGLVYASCVRSSMTYGSETRSLLVDVGLKFERAEMQMIRWMCDISLIDRRTNEELRRLVGAQPITTFIRSDRLRWYGHVMRKGDEDWVKKCMEYRVEGRRPVGRPVGRPRKTWLESVEADSMIHCIESSRQIDKSGSCDHTHMVVDLYVLREVYSWLVPDFLGLQYVCSLMRYPSTIEATLVSIFHTHYTCDIVVISVCIVSVWHWSLTVSTI